MKSLSRSPSNSGLRASVKIAIVGATGTGKSALAAALDIADKTGGVTDPWAAAEAPALTEALTRDLLFQDTSFYPQALRQHRQFSLTLLTGLDLPSASLPDGRVRRRSGRRA